MSAQIVKSFRELVELKYQLYNSLFLTLPLDAVEQTGLLLPLLQEACVTGFEKGEDPVSIVQEFFSRHKPAFEEMDQISFLFKIIQYVERQIVLIDSLEDAAYCSIHRINGVDSWNHLAERIQTGNLCEDMNALLSSFGIMVVLTAHPTQFYPAQVLAIISDLTEAITRDETARARDLLQQLGKTPFFQKMKPTPYDEAVRLTSYLEQIFYPAIGELLDKIAENYPDGVDENNQLIRLGFWPGGDRDGNPFVTVDTTRQVAAKLRNTIVSCYLSDIRKLKRRLSFTGVYEKLNQLEDLLHGELSNTPGIRKYDREQFLRELDEIETILVERHQSLFLEKLCSFKRKVQNFGFHLASLDIRQDSRVIFKVLQAVTEQYPAIFPPGLADLPEKEQIDILIGVEGNADPEKFNDPLVRDTLASFGVIRDIQSENGESGAHRYIISNCRGPLDMARVMSLFRICGWGNKDLSVDLVPLFETVDDLQSAGISMKSIYEHPAYMSHLQKRAGRQTVMLGFSDGTKDGGYLMANWAIYSAKEKISGVSRQAGIEVVFFDGRGGPPARGGGNTHLFYSALSRKIENLQIQITVQGQTISSHFGIREAAVHNLELLLTAGLENKLFDRPERELNAEQRTLIMALADSSYKKYEEFKNHPLFLPYLEERTTLRYYGMANIGSRPSRRGNSAKLRFEDLRAIPFVGAWSQLKQNVPGFFGIGTALKEQEEKRNLDGCIRLYRNSGFFRALISNSMQSMSKTNFSISRYMEKDRRFGEFWKIIYAEYELSRQMVLKISGQQMLMEDSPRGRMSIQLREKVVLPLLAIQQYALIRIQDGKKPGRNKLTRLYEKMVMRSLFGNINASRNSA